MLMLKIMEVASRLQLMAAAVWQCRPTRPYLECRVLTSFWPVYISQTVSTIDMMSAANQCYLFKVKVGNKVVKQTHDITHQNKSIIVSKRDVIHATHTHCTPL